WQKKSPTGTAIAADDVSSQLASSTSDRHWSGCVVSQMCRITPGPSRSASVAVWPAGISILGETFQPRPRSRAAPAPVPSVAMPPEPLAPVGFSALTERLRPAVSMDMPPVQPDRCTRTPSGRRILRITGRAHEHREELHLALLVEGLEPRNRLFGGAV